MNPVKPTLKRAGGMVENNFPWKELFDEYDEEASILANTEYSFNFDQFIGWEDLADWVEDHPYLDVDIEMNEESDSPVPKLSMVRRATVGGYPTFRRHGG